jgi:hypothetical protein
VLKWSRARRRYERQGLPVEEQAIERAEQECLADSEIRKARNGKRPAGSVDQEYDSLRVCANVPPLPGGKRKCHEHDQKYRACGPLGACAESRRAPGAWPSLLSGAETGHDTPGV